MDGATGEEITLTEVDDSGISLLNHMDENQWYRVRVNADGEIVAIGSSKDENLDENQYNGFEDWTLDTPPYQYVSEYDNPEDAINEAVNEEGVDTVLYHEAFERDMLSNKGHTLYVSQDDDTGIRYTENTVVVFDQENDNERTTEFYTGESGVKRVINELHDNPNTPAVDADYEISVVFEDGRATTIVVYDAAEDGDDGIWSEENIAYSEDRMFRLHGNADSAAETIEYNYNTDRLSYSFYVLDGEGVAAEDTDVLYDLRVEMDGDATVDVMKDLTGTTTALGLISDEFYRAFQNGNEVDIYIENVRPFDEEPEAETVTVIVTLVNEKDNYTKTVLAQANIVGEIAVLDPTTLDLDDGYSVVNDSLLYKPTSDPTFTVEVDKVKTVGVNYWDVENNKQAGEGKVTVAEEATNVNISALTDIPEGYELASTTGDVTINDGWIYVEVRPAAEA